MTNNIETRINAVANEQGWTDQSLGEIALSFITSALTPHVQEGFVAHLRQIQQDENCVEGEESLPTLELSAPLVEQTEPLALVQHLRRLGCAVAIFTAEELTAPDGTGLDEREIEETMTEAGSERITFLIEANGLDDSEGDQD